MNNRKLPTTAFNCSSAQGFNQAHIIYNCRAVSGSSLKQTTHSSVVLYNLDTLKTYKIHQADLGKGSI